MRFDFETEIYVKFVFKFYTFISMTYKTKGFFLSYKSRNLQKPNLAATGNE